MATRVTCTLRTRPLICEETAQSTLSYAKQRLGFGDFCVGLLVTSDSTMTQYNKTLRGGRGATDVISIPVLEFDEPEKLSKGQDGIGDLGDIVMSLRYVLKHAKAEGVDENERVQLLLVHSLLHLVGHEHDVQMKWERMESRERELMSELGKRTYVLH